MYLIHRDELRVLGHFVRCQLQKFVADYKNTFIDSLSWPILTALIYGYISPAMGLKQEYGGFMIIGAVVALSYYVLVGTARGITTDIDTVRQVDYDFTLPLRPQLVVFKTGLLAAIQSFLMSVPLPFFCKPLLWDRFDLSSLSLPKYLFFYALVCLMFSFMMVAVAGRVASKDMMHFQVRFVDVLFFSGCFVFPWAKYYEVSPYLGYLILLNPMTYAMEGIRAASIAHEGHLNFWLCTAVMIACIVVFYLYALRAWQKRLDYVRV